MLGNNETTWTLHIVSPYTRRLCVANTLLIDAVR
jgi:hypothetical protein